MALRDHNMILVNCQECGGQGWKDKKVCPACEAVGVWGIWSGRVYVAKLPARVTPHWWGGLLRLLVSFLRIGGGFLLLAFLLGAGWLIVEIWRNAYDVFSEEFVEVYAESLLFLSIVLLLILFWWYLILVGRNPSKRIEPLVMADLDLSADKELSQLSWKTLLSTVKKEVIDVTQYLDWRLRDGLNHASRVNFVQKFHMLNVPSLLYVLSQEQIIQRILRRLNLDPHDFRSRLQEVLKQNSLEGDQDTSGVFLKSDLRRDLIEAWEIASKLEHGLIEVQDVFAASLDSQEALQVMFKKMQITYYEQLMAVAWVDQVDNEFRWWKNWDIRHFKRAGKLDYGWSSGWTVMLDRYSRDLTKEARKGLLPKFVGRTQVIETIDRVLSQTNRNNVLLVGEPGVGRTTLVEGLANKIVWGQVSESLQNKRIIELNMGALTGAAQNEHQFSDTMTRVVSEVREAGNVILFIDNLHLLKGTGAQAGKLDAYHLLLPLLSHSQVQVVGTSTYKEYRQFVELEPELRSVFEVVELKEPEHEDCMEILLEVARDFERRQGVLFSIKALTSSLQLGSRFIQDKVHPDKALNLLDEAAVMAARRGGGQVVTRQDIAQVVASKTNVPVSDIQEAEGQKLLHLEEELHSRVVGQDQAVSSVAAAIRRARVGLKDEKRPIAAFLFVGPTGVGKTELAKALAHLYFGHEQMMVRLDMSEYQEVNSLRRLIGDPSSAGGGEGQLTEAILKRPFCLVLLDEFEKAHKDIHNVFLQVFDDGRLTSSQGKVVDFSNSILIATSNAGAKEIQEALVQGKSSQQIDELLHNELLPKRFKPELLNRFDKVIVFEPLKRQEVAQIAGKFIQQLTTQLDNQQIELKVTSEAVLKLAENGYDPIYGARPLRRLIQDKLEDPIAGRILRGEVQAGDTIVIKLEDVE